MTATERQVMSLKMEIALRLAVRDDLPKLEWYGQYTHFRRVFQRTYEDQLAGRRLMIVAESNGWPIGQVFMQLEDQTDIFSFGQKRGYLYALRVMDAFRSMGIGTALIREAESILIARAYRTVSIAAAKDNPRARKLYERLGYTVVAEDSGYWHYVDHEGRTQHVSEPCWILEKQLRAK